MTIETVNSSQPNQPPLQRQHAGRELRDVESVLLERYRPDLQGVVLELVPGGSRLTEELVHQAGSYIGLGPSTAVIGVCRQIYRAGEFIHAGLTDLDRFEADRFDATIAGRCAIDALDEGSRRTLLERLRRVLKPDGLLIFSSHNRPHEDAVAPVEPPSGRLGAGRLRGFRLRSSRAPMDDRELGNEMLNGIGDGLSVSPYHLTRDEQERQLGEFGFSLSECLDLRGNVVKAGELATESLELHYVARPAEPHPAA